MPDQYLSTDPNAGTAVPANDGYLSTDPSAGEPPTPNFKMTVKASEGVLPDFVTGADGKPSMLGFAKNVIGSGAEFAKGVASPFLHPKDTVNAIATMVSHPGLTGRLIADAAIQRYGSVDNFLKTLYTDPVGAASDASIVLGGAASVAKGAGALKSARAIGMAAEALNPLAIPSKVAETAGRAAYGAAINPSRRIRRGFPGAVDEGYARNVLPTEGGLSRTETALEQSAANTQDLLKQADAASAPGVNVKAQIVPALKDPAVIAGQRYKLGVVDERPGISDRAKNLARRNSQPINLVQSNKLKQQAQSLADTAFRAQERGALIKDLDALSDQRVAQAYRRAIEVNAAKVGVEGVAESNKQTQALIGLAQALEDATQQPSRLTHLMATLGGVGGTLAAGPLGGGGAYVAGRIATAKPVMAATGIMVGKSQKFVRQAQILRALAVLGAGSQQPPDQQQEQAGQRP